MLWLRLKWGGLWNDAISLYNEEVQIAHGHDFMLSKQHNLQSWEILKKDQIQSSSWIPLIFNPAGFADIKPFPSQH